MTSVMKLVSPERVGTVTRGAEEAQFAALCYKYADSGLKVLLITSRGTGRWIIPKGWPIKGKTPAETAAQEAWEEAGVSGKTGTKALGFYRYIKDLDDGTAVPVRAAVYPIHVRKLSASFPEVDERTRRWVSPDEAATLVDEPELQQILKDFAP